MSGSSNCKAYRGRGDREVQPPTPGRNPPPAPRRADNPVAMVAKTAKGANEALDEKLQQQQREVVHISQRWGLILACQVIERRIEFVQASVPITSAL